MKLIPLPIVALILVLLLSNCKKEDIINNKVPVAEAGESQTIQINDESKGIATLTGVGVDSDGQIVGYQWSQVSGPDVAVIVNNGAAITEVKQLITGTYIFQLMVIDDEGATGVDTVSVIVKGPQYVTLQLQPHNNSNEIHILGNQSSNMSGVGTSEIGAAAWTIDGIPVFMRAAFKFDLSSIPATATIKSAKLTLYSNPNPINGHPYDDLRANYGSDNTMLILKVTSSWTAGTVTYSNQPSATATDQVIIPATTERFLDLVDVDVTQLVKDMTGTNINYGFFIKLQNETYYNSRIFCSSNYSDTAKHPKLVVVYSE
jgi:hypothetical protein